MAMKNRTIAGLLLVCCVKVYDAQIHAVEAFMRILPVEKRNGGWE
jgi:hypothetical protein